MKIMTLNTHSWLEANPYEKLQQLANKICEEDYDVIALQEVNQQITTQTVDDEVLKNFCSVKDQTLIHEDNFVYCLIQLLAKQGKDYYWSWEMSHIGYDMYEEGNALLSKTPLISQAMMVSETKAKEDYHTRKILIAQTIINDQEIVVASCHFSWWIDRNHGFSFEWKKLEKHLSKVTVPLFLLGDFNQSEEKEGDQLVKRSFLAIKDAYLIAQKKQGYATIEKKIDGWEKNTENLRIDYIYVPKESQVKEYRSIFDGKVEAPISDHFGVEVVVANDL